MPRRKRQQSIRPDCVTDLPMEIRAHAALGRLLFAFSRLDVNLALYVANYRGEANRAQVIEQLENTSFKEKLSLVLLSTERWYRDQSQCRQDWERWLIHADQLRLQRNDLVHGRWGVNDWHGYVANVVGLPGSPNQRETQYSVSELEAEARQAESLSQEFYRLSTKWPA